MKQNVDVGPQQPSRRLGDAAAAEDKQASCCPSPQHRRQPAPKKRSGRSWRPRFLQDPRIFFDGRRLALFIVVVAVVFLFSGRQQRAQGLQLRVASALRDPRCRGRPEAVLRQGALRRCQACEHDSRMVRDFFFAAALLQRFFFFEVFLSRTKRREDYSLFWIFFSSILFRRAR